MKKRLLALLLAGAMVAISLTACSNKTSVSEETTSSETQSETEEETMADVKLEATPADYSSNCTLGEYKGISIEVDSAEVTEEQLQSAREEIISAGTTYEKVTDRVTKDGDTIHVIYTGFIDGESFDGGSTGVDGKDYTIGGSQKFFDELDKQMIGLECGKTYNLKATFPENMYPEGNSGAKLNGKAATFDVKVEYIQGDPITPEWTDELVNSVTKGEYKTIAAYEEYAKGKIKESNESTQKESFESKLWETILGNCEYGDLPQEKLSKEYERYYAYTKSYYTNYASYYGYSYEDFLTATGTSDEMVQFQCYETTKYSVKTVIAAILICQKEGITVTEAEYNEAQKEIAKASGYSSIEELEKAYTQEYLLENMYYDKASEYLYANNTMTVKAE